MRCFAALPLLLLAGGFAGAAQAHHGDWYSAIYLALEEQDLASVKDLFDKAVWSNEKADGTMTGEKLAKKVKAAAFACNFSEGGGKDENGNRTHASVSFTLIGKDLQTAERWFLRARTKDLTHPRTWRVKEVLKQDVPERMKKVLAAPGFLKEVQRVVGLFGKAKAGETLPKELAPYIRKARVASLKSAILSVYPWGENKFRLTMVVRMVPKDGEEIADHLSYASIDIHLKQIEKKAAKAEDEDAGKEGKEGSEKDGKEEDQEDGEKEKKAGDKKAEKEAEASPAALWKLVKVKISPTYQRFFDRIDESKAEEKDKPEK